MAPPLDNRQFQGGSPAVGYGLDNLSPLDKRRHANLMMQLESPKYQIDWQMVSRISSSWPRSASQMGRGLLKEAGGQIGLWERREGD